jgi:hypothetical protein
VTGEVARTLLLIGTLACAVLVIALSFLSWVDFRPEANASIPELKREAIFSLRGTELSRIRGPQSISETNAQVFDACSCRSDFGDGYLTAILGGVAAAAAVGAFLLRHAKRSLIIVAMLAALTAFTIAGYNAIAIWEGVGRSDQGERLMNLDGSVRAELYALTAIAGLAAVLGGAALATTVQPEPRPEEEGEPHGEDATSQGEASEADA